MWIGILLKGIAFNRSFSFFFNSVLSHEWSAIYLVVGRTFFIFVNREWNWEISNTKFKRWRVLKERLNKISLWFMNFLCLVFYYFWNLNCTITANHTLLNSLIFLSFFVESCIFWLWEILRRSAIKVWQVQV